MFRHAVAHLIFTRIWCRKYAQIEIEFMTTRVWKPDEDDWKELRRLGGYLKHKIKLPLILRAYGVNMKKWWIDAPYAAHNDMLVHIGGIM